MREIAADPFPTFTSRGDLAHRRAIGTIFASTLLQKRPRADELDRVQFADAGALKRRIETKTAPIARRCARLPREVNEGVLWHLDPRIWTEDIHVILSVRVGETIYDQKTILQILYNPFFC